METLSTVIEFVNSSSGEGIGRNESAGIFGNVADTLASSNASTSDFMFALLTVLFCICAIGGGFFLHLRNKRTVANNDVTGASILADVLKPNCNKAFGLLACGIVSVIVILCIVVCSHNAAFANSDIYDKNSGIAIMSEKVQAKVDDAGNVVIDKGTIVNNDDVLAVGVRQVKSDTTIDLSESILTINCDDKELYKNNLGNIQLNNKYVTVPVSESAELSYDLKISAEKARQLIGASPVTLDVTFDLVVSKRGLVTDADGVPVEGVRVSYSYADPYDQSEIVEGVVQTDSKGYYKIPDVKCGETVYGEVTYQKSDRIFSDSFEIVFNDETDIPVSIVKTEPQTSDLEFVAPDGFPNIVYNGLSKTASFKQSDTCPAGLGNVTVQYRCDGQDEWTEEAPVNAGKYFVRADIEEGKGCCADTLENDNWNFIIKRAEMSSTTIDKVDNVTYNGSAFTPEPAVSLGTYNLLKDKDFVYSYKDNINVGTATIYVSAIDGGNFNGAKSATWTITAKSIEECSIAPIPDQAYTGRAIEPNVDVTDGEKTLTKGSDYKVIYFDNVNAGTAKASFTGIGNYENSTDKTFIITKKTKGVSITFDASSGICDVGSSVNFNVVSVNGFEESSTIDYTSSSENPQIATVDNIGTAEGALQSFKVNGVTEGSTSITVRAESANCVTSATYNVSVTKSGKLDPEFTPDQSMPKEDAVYNMVVSGSELVTSATTVSDGEADASSSNTNVAKVSAVKSSSVDGISTITYAVQPVGVGRANISLGVKESSTYNEVHRNFSVEVAEKAKTQVAIPKAKENLVFNGFTIVGFDNLDTSLYYANNFEQTDASTYTAFFDLKDKINYEWSNHTSFIQNVDWKINPANMDTTAIANVEAQIYTGSEIQPEPAVSLGAYSLIKDTDFAYTYENNTNAGIATITMTGKDVNFTGSITKEFIINKADMTSTTVAEVNAVTYTGSAQTPEPAVTFNGKTLVKDIDFTYSYSNNTNAGTATITMTGKEGNFTGSTTKEFIINKADMTSTTVADVEAVTYTGSAYTPEPEVAFNETKLMQGSDFTYSYSNNTNAGTAAINLSALDKSNFTGTKTTYFTINQKTEGVSITFDASSGECEAFSTTEFKVIDASGFIDARFINYSASSADESIATVKKGASSVGSYPTFEVKGRAAGNTTINVKAESQNCLTNASYKIDVKEPTKLDPSFTPDQSMPGDGTTYNMIVDENNFETSATTVSDGSGIAKSTNEEVAKVSSTIVNDEAASKIVYTIYPLSVGETDIELGVSGTDKYASDSVSFKVKVKVKGMDSITPIQRTVGDKLVTFLPAFTDDEKLGQDTHFYAKLQDNKYQLISNENMTMANLSAELEKYEISNIYVSASPNKLYGFLDSAWSTAFVKIGGLTSEMISMLGSQYKTVYYVSNYDRDPAPTGNWDKSKDEEPTLGSVGYSSFYYAYSKLLSTRANQALGSSFNLLFNNVNSWLVSNDKSEWVTSYLSDLHGIVLTYEFKDDPQFMPDQSMPAHGSIKNMVSGNRLETSATTISDGNIIASSSDENVAKVSYDIETIGESKLIKYNIETFGSGICDITLGVAESTKYAGALRTFKIDSSEFKPIQYNVGDQSLIFLPALKDGETLGDRNLKFYKKEGEHYYEISYDSMTMENLAKQIKNYGAQNIYTNAINSTFYSVMRRTWNDTFVSPLDASGLAGGLTDSMKGLLGNNFKTVYFENNDDIVPTSSGNWDAPDYSTEPILGSCGYNSFYKAYKDLQDEFMLNVWSSKIMDKDYPYNWSPSSSHWINPEYKATDSQGVVLSLDFKERRNNPEFKPDNYMPAEDSTYNKAAPYSVCLETTAKTISDGDVIALSSDPNIASVSIIDDKWVGSTRHITYKISPVNVGTVNISLGIKQTDNFEGYVRNFSYVVREYVPIQQYVGDKLMTFVPAFNTGMCPCNFYYKTTEGKYEKLEGINSMLDLAKKIKDRVGSIYTDAFVYNNLNFYTTIDKNWDDVFIKDEDYKPAIGLQSDFRAMLESSGVKTIYGDYDSSGNWIINSSGNWDKHSDDAPKLGSAYDVEYQSFYYDYDFNPQSDYNFGAAVNLSEDVWSSRYSREVMFIHNSWAYKAKSSEAKDVGWRTMGWYRHYGVVLVREFN